MSAYVVDRDHIAYLIEAALSGRDGMWFECDYVNENRAAKLGQMLWDENVRSVRARYPDCEDELPGPIGCDYQYGEHERLFALTPAPVAVLKACACYDYQACETEDYPKTDAADFINALRLHMIHQLPGYEEADWEPSYKAAKERSGQVVRLSDFWDTSDSGMNPRNDA